MARLEAGDDLLDDETSGDGAASAQVFEAASERAPQDPFLALGRAWTALDAHDMARAVALSEPALEVSSIRGDALAIRARARQAEGDQGGAAALWLQAYEARPTLP